MRLFSKHDLWRRMLRQPAFAVGAGLLVFIVLIAIAAPWISPYDPYAQDIVNRTVPPVWDALGL